ncbi:MAG: hypothetical protein HY901_29400, partial [Deltaproteobacteria bacterium]|nr:hypothetical protein [Deltaproteobacteria bacterium]
MPSKPKRSRMEKELEALSPALQEPRLPASRELLRTALLHSQSFVAAKAAFAIRDRLVAGLEADLKAAFDRFL